MSKDIRILPEGHEKYKHKFFPVGDRIPVCVKDSYVIDSDEPLLRLKVSYGPYIRYEIINKSSVKDIDDIRFKDKIQLSDRVESHVVSEKSININYTCDDLFAIINLFSQIGVTTGRYPDKDPETHSEKLSTLNGLKEMFDEFFITPRRECYVDTEFVWTHKIGGIVLAKSKINII